MVQRSEEFGTLDAKTKCRKYNKWIYVNFVKQEPISISESISSSSKFSKGGFDVFQTKNSMRVTRCCANENCFHKKVNTS